MPNFLSLNTATQALLAHRSVIDVISNNIANVNTPGYVRRVAELASTYVEDARYGSVGTGVSLAQVSARRALFLDGRFRTEQAGVGEADVGMRYLGRIEGMTGEPGEGGVSATLDAFFSSWVELANDPTDTSLKHDVADRARQLAGSIRRLHENLQAERRSADDELVLQVDEMNRALSDIASLNGRIREAELGGGEASDLRDRRNEILNRLSELAPIRTSEGEDGQITVYLAGRTLVTETVSRPLDVQARIDDGLTLHRLTVDGGEIEFDGGAMGALQTLRDEKIPGYLRSLDLLAGQLIERVNAIHSQGAQGLDFFSGSGAGDIALSSVVSADPTRIETSLAGSTSDNDLARALADLADTTLAALSGRSFGAFHRDLVVVIGGDSSAARFQLEAREATRDQILAQREQVEAVSLDEEMANLIAAEHAYEAAARVVTTVTDMLDTLLSLA